MRFGKRATIPVAALIGTMICATSLAATIRYVAPSGAGDGSSWSSPMGHPQEATDASVSGDEVWVAAGTYKEWNSSGSVLTMKDGVSVCGGFVGTPGTEGDFGSQDPTTNVTILDGDTNNSTVADAGDCESVVVGASNTSLDGFTITHGFAAANGGGT